MKMIFVYNARSGPGHKFLDFAHKLLYPSSYSCELCKITHSNFGEKDDWLNFRNQYGSEMVFYYIDQFESQYHRKFEYPVLLLDQQDQLEVVLTKKDFAKISDVESLINTIKLKTVFKT